MIKDRLRLLLLVPLSALWLLAAAPGPVAAATCYDTGCAGKSPQTTGCSTDAITTAWVYIKNSAGTNVGKVELRWSDTCQAGWSRVTSYIGAATIREWVQDAYGTYSDTDYNATQAYSPMAGGSLEGMTACGRLNGSAVMTACKQFLS